MPPVERRVIKKIYWITHPAYPVLVGRGRTHFSVKDMRTYFENILYSVVKKAQTEPDSVVVLVKTKLSTDLYTRFSDARAEKTKALEDSLEKLIKRMMKQRCFVVETESSIKAARVVRGKISRRFRLDADFVVEGYGSYWKRHFVLNGRKFWASYCAAEFPKNFYLRNSRFGRKVLKAHYKKLRKIPLSSPSAAFDFKPLRGKVVVPETGSIAYKTRFAGWKPLKVRKRLNNPK